MSSNTGFPSIPLSDVFDDLASSSSGSLTVLTPNRRLARAVKSEFDRIQAAKGATAWNSADVLPISAFVERIYSEALYSSEVSALPVLLSPVQEQVLWEDVVNCSESGRELLDVGEAARLASEAWRLAHAWHLIPQLDRHLLSEDARAFRQWSRQYEETARRAHRTDKARLGGLVLEFLARPEITKPRRLVCYGFDIVTPQHAALLTRFKEVGCEVVIAQVQRLPVTTKRNMQRLACDDVRDEMQRAAQWARANLEAAPSARIGIVAPDLTACRSAIFRIFSAVMEPDVGQGPAQPGRELPFNISLGEPLISYPLVNAALLLLDLSVGKVAFERVSVLLRSPFISGGEAEMAQRALLDIRLRKRAEEMVTLDRLLVLLERERNSVRCPDLLRILAALSGFSKTALSGLQKPSALARGIAEALRLVGFPGERRLDSSEYQVLKKWQEVLAGFATLDSVISRTACKHAVTRLRRMAAEVIFQPETADVPIQILGALESAGMTFDHLWVMGLSDDAWPPQAQPNPFLPLELQRGVPWSSAQATLELASRLTDHWLGAADEVVLSHPRHGQGSETREISFSPLIESISAGALALPLYPVYRDLIHETRKLERLEDRSAPALTMAPDIGASAQVNGGMAVIKDHAICEFRSFALYRLRAERPEKPASALGPAERGTLIHYVLAEVWRKLKTKDGLEALSEADLEMLLQGAANDAIDRLRRDHPLALSARFSEIERDRLVRLASEWLSQDRKRADFSVVAVEEKRTIEIGGLALTARLDRVDELADGRRVIIDYKSRAPTAGAMLDERPDEPQLPLYLVAAEPEAVAVAFAQVKPGDTRFVALARDNDLLPGAVAFPGPRLKVKYTSWNELVDSWRTDLTSIATSFSTGRTRMNPRKYPHTCRNCEFRSLCRIDERVGGAFGQDEESE